MSQINTLASEHLFFLGVKKNEPVRPRIGNESSFTIWVFYDNFNNKILQRC